MKHQKTRRDTDDWKSTINQLDLIDIYRILHPATAEYTFFPRLQGTFTKTHHILSHKTHLNTFRLIEVIQSMF